jgi:outer membrane PBP1 activator LpoA protein
MPRTQPSAPLLLLLAAALAAVAGCATSVSEVPSSVDRADRLQRRGDNAAAAEMYERLARANPPPERNDLALAAARAWLAANRADDAQRALDLAVAENRAAQLLELGMLRAEVAEARGQQQVAWQQISALPQPADPAAAARLLQLRQRIALNAGLPLEAVRAGLALEPIAGTEAERAAARRELLAGLRSAIEGGLRIDLGASNDPLIRGWLEIAQIAATASRSPLTAEADVARWRTRFPGHPAATIVDREILHPGERLAEARPGTAVATGGPVALLLPLTPRDARERSLANIASPFIRAGFESALSRMPESDRPQLQVYDTGVLGVGAALLNAQANGTGFIVGPLEKEEVQAAWERRPAGLPLLLLNTPPGGGYLGSQIYQFALAPEDAARQIARQVATAGRGNAVVLAPRDEWGNRVAAAFAQELAQDGGAVIAQGSYDDSQVDFTVTLKETVSALLGIDAARARQQRVQSTIGAAVEFDAYPRPDIDAIFTPGYDETAVRTVKSLLYYYNAGDIPTYISQDGVSPDRNSNRDLAGTRLLDMPWVLDTIGPVANLRAATQSEWADAGAYSRYFAFGYDAATLAMVLRRGSTAWPLAGLTGRLQLTADGRIERSLNWARIGRDGSLQPFDPVSTLP